jgi:hypothetical protein
MDVISLHCQVSSNWIPSWWVLGLGLVFRPTLGNRTCWIFLGEAHAITKCLFPVLTHIKCIPNIWSKHIHIVHWRLSMLSMTFNDKVNIIHEIYINFIRGCTYSYLNGLCSFDWMIDIYPSWTNVIHWLMIEVCRHGWMWFIPKYEVMTTFEIMSTQGLLYIYSQYGQVLTLWQAWFCWTSSWT